MGLQHRLRSLERQNAPASPAECRCRVEIIETEVVAPPNAEALRRAGHSLVPDDQLPLPIRCGQCGRFPTRIVVVLRASPDVNFSPERW